MSYEIDKEKVSSLANTTEVGAYYKEAIVKFATDYLANNKELPKAKEIHLNTGVPLKSVYNHLPLKMGDYVPAISVETPKVLAKLAAEAKKGNIQAIKLYMQIVEGWSESKNSSKEQSSGGSSKATNITVKFENFKEQKPNKIVLNDVEDIDSDEA